MSSPNPEQQLLSDALWLAVRNGDLPAVRAILGDELFDLDYGSNIPSDSEGLQYDYYNEGFSDVECVAQDSWSVVHEAALLGHFTLLEYFKTLPGFSQYITSVARDHHAQTPLVCAIGHGHVEAFKVLWQWLDEEGGQADFLERQANTDRYQWTLLGWAVYSGSIEAVDHILSLKLPEMDIRCTKPPLFNPAMTKGSLELIRHLIDLGADVNSCPGKTQTPLTMAVRRGLLGVVKTMVLYGNADINARDDRGNTALDIAEKAGQFECAAFLRSIMLKEGSLDASSNNDNFSMTVFWFRPRLLGPLLSARAFATSIIIDNYLYITAGQGYSEGEPCPSPDNYQSPTPHPLPYQLHRVSLPALDLPILPPNAPPLHTALIASYEKLRLHVPAPKLRRMRTSSQFDTNSPHAQRWSSIYGSDLNAITDSEQLELKYVPSGVQAPAVTFACLPLPKRFPITYFEITLLEVGQYTYIAIGVSRLCDDTEQHLGWTINAYGCHADIGCVFHNSGSGAAFAPKFQKNDIIGCGIDFQRRELFYTVNGKWIGVAHQGLDTTLDWHPAVSLQSPGEHLRANFGSEPFLFDFMAPTLTMEPMSVTTSLGDQYDGPARLATAPVNQTETRLALIRFGARTMHFFTSNNQDKELKDKFLNDEASIRKARQLALGASDGPNAPRLWINGADWTWKAVNLVAEPTSVYSTHEFWRMVPQDPSADLVGISTETHWFGVFQKADAEQTHIIMSVIGIEWDTGLVSRVDLPPLSLPKKNTTNSTYRMECSLDSSSLSAWSFYLPEIYSIDTAPIFQSIREKATATELPPNWRTTPSVGPHPPSSRLTLAPLSDHLMLCFGGFEEIAPQNAVQVLDSRAATGPKWIKPRINGSSIPRARFFTTLSSTSASPSNNSQYSTVPHPASSSSFSSSSSTYHPHLQYDGHDYTIYAVGGWNGWSAVYDFDIAHVSLPKPVVDASMTALNDITIIAHDGTPVETAKIMLYCRSSFFRSLFRAYIHTIDNPQLLYRQSSRIQLDEVIQPKSSGEKIMGSSLRVLIGFLTTDSLSKSTIDSVTNLLRAVEVLCPEHLPRVQDELFASRMTHPSTFSVDLALSLDSNCVIPCDMLFLPTATPSSASSVEGDNKDLKMHTYIAALKSPFFKAMVSGDFIESRLADGLRSVPLQTDHALARLFIVGICSGKVDLGLVGDRIIDLFELAHSLQASELLDFIEAVLCSNIDSDNVDMLESVANDHNATKLQEACSAYRIAQGHSIK